MIDETGYSVLGGDAEAVDERSRRSSARASTQPCAGGRGPRARRARSHPRARELEVATLDRNGRRRAFRRSDTAEIAAALESAGPVDADPPPRSPEANFVDAFDGTPITCGHATPDLRDRERVRRHLHAERAASVEPGRGRPLPVPSGRLLGSIVQRLPRKRGSALPRRRLAPRVRHARVRLRQRARRTRQGRGADPRAARRQRPGPPAEEGIRGQSTSSRTTPTPRATPTAATRTT